MCVKPIESARWADLSKGSKGLDVAKYKKAKLGMRAQVEHVEKVELMLAANRLNSFGIQRLTIARTVGNTTVVGRVGKVGAHANTTGYRQRLEHRRRWQLDMLDWLSKHGKTRKGRTRG